MHFPIVKGSVLDTHVHSVVLSMKFQEEVHLEGSNGCGKFEKRSFKY